MARQRRRGGWLSSLLGGGPEDPPGTTYELVVLEGADSGSVHPIDAPQRQIGRKIAGSASDGSIGLTDRSVSSRHALVSHEDGEITIEHLPSATNPTLVNGRRIKKKRIRDGDRIVLGLVVLELRARRPAAEHADGHGAVGIAPSEISTEPVNVHGELVLTEGSEDLANARFPLIRRKTSIGRDEDCDIVLDIASISRRHASLVWEDDHLVLIHESAVNPTHVNGMEIRDRRRLFHGDAVRISDRVAFQVVLEASGALAPEADSPAAAPVPPVREEEATRMTTPPQPEAVPADPEEPTRVSMTPPPASQPKPQPKAQPAADDTDPAEAMTRISDTPPPQTTDDGEATRIDAVPEVAAGAEAEVAPDVAATRIDAVPEPEAEVDESEAAATRVFEAQDLATEPTDAVDDESGKAAFADAAATRIAPVPDAGDYSGGDATRVAPAPSAADYSAGDATRVAPSPTAGDYSAGDATRIAPAPDLTPPAASADETRVAGTTNDSGAPGGDGAADEPGDSDRTLIRPSPVAAPSDGERTRVVDLNAQLARDLGPGESGDADKAAIRPNSSADPETTGDADKTLIRPRPAEPDDASRTVIRPRPEKTADAASEAPAPAETVIIEPDDDD